MGWEEREIDGREIDGREMDGKRERYLMVWHSLSLHRSLELFPKLLSVIAAQPIIRYQRGELKVVR